MCKSHQVEVASSRDRNGRIRFLMKQNKTHIINTLISYISKWKKKNIYFACGTGCIYCLLLL